MSALLQVTGLHAGYGRAEVLSGLNFQLAQGQVVTIIGPNGAGKTTTLNALMGVLPSRGRVVFDGTDLADVTLEERVMLGLALVPEKRELFGTMPVEDNLILGGYRAMKLKLPNWRGALERVYTLFPRLKERRSQLAGKVTPEQTLRAQAAGGSRGQKRFERGLQWVREWLDGGVIVNGRPTPSIEKVRGDAAAKRLRDDCREQWARGSRGEPGVWR